MLSIEDLAAVRIAVEICCCPKLKKQILFIPEKPENVEDGGYWQDTDLKNEWDEKLEKSSTEILEKIGVMKCQQKKVIDFVQQTGIKMLIWAKYHERFLGISRNFSVDFLNSSLFTSKGIIDNKKAAEELLKCQTLNVKQRYKLACLCCFTDEIPVLFKQMSKEEQKLFYISGLILQPKIVKFWSYGINSEIETLIGKERVMEYLLENAIECRSKAAVEYIVEKAKLIQNLDVVKIAVEKTLKNSGTGVACRNILATGRPGQMYRYSFNFLRYDNSIDPFFPSSFYVDILCFLFHKLTVDQKVAVLRKDIDGVFNEVDEFTRKSNKYSRILGYFCNWSYQEYFLTTVNLMWDFLPESNFVDLLEQISSKLKCDREFILFGDAKAYNYKKLLMEFWNKSPNRFKSFVFRRKDKETSFNIYGHDINELPENVKFLGILLLLKNFTNEDRKNYELILASASKKEKRDIIFSGGAQNICIELMRENNWGRLNLFVFNCLTSQEEINNFKRKFFFTNKAKKVFIDFAGKQKWDAVDSFIGWSALSGEKITQLKNEIMLSKDFKRECQNLIQEKEGMEIASKFCEWFSSSKEMFEEFKKEFVYSDIGFETCCFLVFTGNLEQADEFIQWCLSVEKITDYKVTLANRYESLEYIFAISCQRGEEDPYEFERRFRTVLDSTKKFEGGTWEQVETFLTWCLSSVEKINEFKDNTLYDENSYIILGTLLRNNELKEAEAYITWLDLSSDEIRELKFDLIMTNLESEVQYMVSCIDSDIFIDEWEYMQSCLKWGLIDEESVLKYKKKLHEEFAHETLELANEGHKKMIRVLKKFDDFLEEMLCSFSIL